MNHTLLERAKIFLQAHKNKSIWHRITTSLAAVVVFVTTYMLILPAITMERPTVCGLEEHTHTKACYASSLKAALHEHDASCYDANGSLVCQRPVVRLHEHTDECYKDSNLICGQIAYQGHTHTDACYTWEKVLVCGDGAGSSINADGEILIDEGAAETPQTSAHVHTDDCYRMEKVLTCLLAEGPGHTHTAACYDGPRQLICGHDGMVEIIWPDSPVEYVSANDTGKILICGKKEHKHTDSCYADETPQSETKAQTEPQTIVVAETEAVTESQAITETEAVTEAEAETQIVTEAQTELVTEAQNTTEAETQVVTETEAVTEPQVATEAETQIATEAQTEQVTETQIATEAQTEPVTEAQTELVTETQNTTEAETQVVTDTEAETQIATEAQTELVTETQTEFSTEIESESETASEVEPETATETATEMAAEPEPETEFSTEIESESEAVSEAETESGTEIQTETETEVETETETETEAESEIGTEAETEIETETESDTESETEIESETGTWTDEALEEAFRDGMIDSYCVVSRQAVMSRARSVMRAKAVNRNSIDFADYITSVKVSKILNGQWQDATEFTDGDQVRVALSYRLPTGVVTTSNKQIYYQLPAGINLFQEESGKVYYNGLAVGNYVIGTDGLIVIDFYDEFATGEAFTGKLEFEGTMSSDDAASDGKIIFKGDGTTLTIKEKNKAHDIGIKKEGKLDSDKEHINYAITVSTTNGTEDKVTISDKFSSKSASGSYRKDSFVLSKIDVSGKKTKIENPQIEIKKDGDQENFEIKDLPELEPGESYVLEYTGDIEVNDTKTGAASLGNTAKASSGSDNRESWNYVEISKSMISKSGSYDNNKDEINWTITVNPDKKDISGWVLKDVLPTGITCIFPVAIKDSTGKVTATLWNAEELASYTFPSDSKETYTITYTTTAPAENGKVQNTAEILGGGKNYSDTASADVTHRTWGLDKSYIKDVSDQTGTQYVWSSTITIPTGKMTEFTYTDTIKDPDGQNGVHYGIASELEKKLKENFSLKLKGVDNGLGYESAAEYVNVSIKYYNASGEEVSKDDSQEKVTKFEVTVTSKEGKSFEAQSLNLEYYTHVDYSGMESGEKWTFRNTGKVGEIEKTAAHDYTKPKPIQKYAGVYNSDGTISYRDDTTKVDWYTTNGILYYRLLVRPESSNELVIEDQLPEGATFVEGSLSAGYYANDNTDLGSAATFYYSESGAISYDFSGKQEPVAAVTKDNKLIITIAEGYFGIPGKKPGGTTLGKIDTIAILYRLSVKDDPNWKDIKNTKKYYTNTVSWDGFTDERKTEVTKKVKEVEKSAEQLNDEEGNPTNRVSYSVKINQAGLDLVPKSDILTVEDTLTVKTGRGAALDLGTVKLYRYDNEKEDGIGEPIAESDYSMQYKEEKNDSGKPIYKITLTLPDEVPCILVYEYVLDKGAIATEMEIFNAVELNGMYSDSKSTTLKKTSSSGTVERVKVEIFKVDSKNYSVRLDGAKFKLSAWNGSNWEEMGSYEAEKGYLLLNSKSTLEEETLYRIEEVEAPKGYAVSDIPYYFIIMKPEVASAANAENTTWSDMKSAGGNNFFDGSDVIQKDVRFVGTSGAAIYVPNESTSIQVKKVWADSKGQEVQKDSGDITVNLMRSTRKPVGYEVELKFLYRDWDGTYKPFTNQIKEKICVEPGSSISYSSQYGSWGKKWQDVFGEVSIDGNEDTGVTGKDAFNGGSAVITTSAVNSNCTVTIRVKEDNYWVSKEELLSHISYTAPKTHTEKIDQSFGENGMEQIHLNSGNNWSKLFTDLAAKDQDSNPYYYTVEEVGGSNYNVVYTNNGIQTGTIYIKNTIPDKEDSYILPETGGSGSRMYMIGGAMLALLAVILLYIKTVSRRCMADCATPSESDHFRNDYSGLLSGGSNKRGKEDRKSP